MKAIAITQSGPAHVLQDVELPRPQAQGRDLLIQVHAVAVNPVDTKVRASAAVTGAPKVLGWDASGVVAEVGPDCKNFKVGDRVWYAGDLTRQGSNAEFQLVDERIVGRMPSSLSFAQAAAMPLTAITAYELLFERLGFALDGSDQGQTLMIVGAAGGVGSVLSQMAHFIAGLRVIATASRPQSQNWLYELGIKDVLNHRESMVGGLKGLGLDHVDALVSLTHTDTHLPQIVELIRPQGRFGLIDDPQVLDARPFKRKSISLHWELMFTRSMYQTPDMDKQGALLGQVADWVDQGLIQCTLGVHYGQINALNLQRAHQTIESQTAIGKIVLEGF